MTCTVVAASRAVSGCGAAFSCRRLGGSSTAAAAARHSLRCATCSSARRSNALRSVSLSPSEGKHHAKFLAARPWLSLRRRRRNAQRRRQHSRKSYLRHAHFRGQPIRTDCARSHQPLPDAHLERGKILRRRTRVPTRRRRRYGASRVHLALRSAKHRMVRKRVARLMRAAGLTRADVGALPLRPRVHTRCRSPRA